MYGGAGGLAAGNSWANICTERGTDETAARDVKLFPNTGAGMGAEKTELVIELERTLDEAAIAIRSSKDGALLLRQARVEMDSACSKGFISFQDWRRLIARAIAIQAEGSPVANTIHGRRH